ncbi:MAG TPA: GldG family protein [Thermoanaerobaculia bacterium]|nr:GldG family protein [Thermoanaerobaculia bacterium]
MSARTGGRRRAAAAGLFSASIAVILGIWALVNWLGYRHWSRGDWTKARLYSVSSTTKKIVGNLKTPVRVTAFMTHRNRLYSETRELLDRYKALSPQIKVEEIDPERNPALAQSVASQMDVQRTGTLVFQAGTKKKFVTEDDMAEYDFGAMPGQGGGLKAFKGEQAFTSAILAVTAGKSPKIYFTSGHGEKSIDDAAERGLSDVKDLLAKDNDTVATWESLGKSEVPKDADLVVVAGPQTAFLAPERDALDKYLAAGGHALVMVDPVIPRPGVPATDLGLGTLLAGWGVKLDDDIVIDTGNALPFMGPETVYANHFGSHPIVDPLASAKMAVIFPLSRSVETGTAAHAGFSATALVQTTGEGWGETDLAHLGAVKKDPSDVQAPVTIAMAVSRGKETAAPAATDPQSAARLVVVGDSDFAANAELPNVSNANFVLNTAHWLIGSGELVGIAPKTPEQNALTVSASTLRRIGFLSLLGIPALALAAGVAVWAKRRG